VGDILSPEYCNDLLNDKRISVAFAQSPASIFTLDVL